MLRRFTARSTASATERQLIASRRCFLSVSTPLLGKIIPFNLADIGEGILKVEVTQWLVKPGDRVAAFDKLCEVQSDKATVEIPSRFDGVIKKLYVPQAGTAFVGKPLVDIELDGDHAAEPEKPSAAAAAPTAAPAATSAAATSAPAAAEAKSAEQLATLATPAVRHLAKVEKVDLSKITATGKGGRIMKEDLLAFIAGGSSAPAAAAASPATSSSAAPARTAKGDTVIPIVGIQKAMVASMRKANEIPAFGASDEIEISRLIQTRDTLRPMFAARDATVKLSFMPFFLKAASLALNEFPMLNAHTNDDCTTVTYKGAHNIGFAMDTPSGLIVPNVKNVDQKSLYEIAVDIRDLMKRGADKKLRPDDLQGGTFTLSNIGSIGATYTRPVIFPPQVVIGAIGKSVRVPRFDENDKVIAANIINISWSADHRVVDGATMVRYSNLFKQLLEEPARMLVDLK